MGTLTVSTGCVFSTNKNSETFCHFLSLPSEVTSVRGRVQHSGPVVKQSEAERSNYNLRLVPARLNKPVV